MMGIIVNSDQICNFIKTAKMQADTRISTDPETLGNKVAEDFCRLAGDTLASGGSMHVAISGGTTPGIIFRALSAISTGRIHWERIHFYWVDERCVPPDDEDSNYRMASQALFSKVNLPAENINRIRGEEEPSGEAIRYGNLVRSKLPMKNGVPSFDLVMLGLGEDGHTASIFPDQMALLQSGNICEVAIHPKTGQKRITLCGKVINGAAHVWFIVTGKEKSRILRSVLLEKKRFFPAAHIHPNPGKLVWYLDQAAAGGLSIR